VISLALVSHFSRVFPIPAPTFFLDSFAPSRSPPSILRPHPIIVHRISSDNLFPPHLFTLHPIQQNLSLRPNLPSNPRFPDFVKTSDIVTTSQGAPRFWTPTQNFPVHDPPILRTVVFNNPQQKIFLRLLSELSPCFTRALYSPSPMSNQASTGSPAVRPPPAPMRPPHQAPSDTFSILRTLFFLSKKPPPQKCFEPPWAPCIGFLSAQYFVHYTLLESIRLNRRRVQSLGVQSFSCFQWLNHSEVA